MMSHKMLHTIYEYSYFLVSQGIENIDHKDSLIFPAKGINSANWILGHILTSRSNVMAMLKLDPPWDIERCKPYLPDSAPLSPDDKVENFEEMKIALAQTQTDIMETIRNITEEELNKASGENTLGEDLAGYAIHEAMHAGELAMLKNLINSK